MGYYTFNCYIISILKTEQERKKGNKSRKQKNLAVRFSKIVVLRSFLNLSKFFPFLIQSSKTFHIFGAVAADDSLKVHSRQEFYSHVLRCTDFQFPFLFFKPTVIQFSLILLCLRKMFIPSKQVLMLQMPQHLLNNFS